jgi:hypothetical protein
LTITYVVSVLLIDVPLSLLAYGLLFDPIFLGSVSRLIFFNDDIGFKTKHQRVDGSLDDASGASAFVER